MMKKQNQFRKVFLPTLPLFRTVAMNWRKPLTFFIDRPLVVRLLKLDLIFCLIRFLRRQLSNHNTWEKGVRVRTLHQPNMYQM